MPSRQDQLHSYQFAVQRVVAALVMRETDPAQSPFRRAAGATLASLLVAVIALGGVALYGLFVGGGSNKWQDSGKVIVEKESGARYVYRDGKLHPVLNYASALLIIGTPGTAPVFVSAKSIEGVARGAPLGIPDAPDSLTRADRLAGHPWAVCSGSVPTAGAGSHSLVLVGEAPQGGTVLGDEQGVLVAEEGGRQHLIWRNRRHLVRDERTVLPVLSAAGRSRPVVAPAFVNSVPAGADLAPLTIPGRGDDFPALPGAKIGEVFVITSQGGGKQYAVATREGLAAITQLQADLLLSDDATSQATNQDAATPLGQADFARMRPLPNPESGAAAPPPTPPKLVDVDTGVLCAVVRGDNGVAEMRVNATSPDMTNAVRTSARTADGTVLADFVVVEPGRGAVVEAVSAPGAPGALSIVTSLGRRYPVPTEGVLGTLGYAGVKPVRLPAPVVALLPAGRALDPEAARVPAVQG